jgi:hypothetical protein
MQLKLLSLLHNLQPPPMQPQQHQFNLTMHPPQLLHHHQHLYFVASCTRLNQLSQTNRHGPHHATAFVTTVPLVDHFHRSFSTNLFDVSLPTAGGDFTASQQAQEVVAESKTARNEPTLASSTATATVTPAPPEAAPVIANVNADDLTAKSPQDAPAIAAPINISAPAAEQITITNTTAMSTQVSTEPAPTSTSISAATAPPAASNKQLELLSQNATELWPRSKHLLTINKTTLISIVPKKS